MLSLSKKPMHALTSLMVIVAFLAFSACSDPTTSDKSESESPDESVDEPAWINGSYLTCAWDKVESDTEAGVFCHLDADDTKGLNTQDLKIEWGVQKEDGSNGVATSIAAAADPSRATLVMVAAEISGQFSDDKHAGVGDIFSNPFGKPDHSQAFAAALRVPDDAALTTSDMVLGSLDAEVLVVTA